MTSRRHEILAGGNGKKKINCPRLAFLREVQSPRLGFPFHRGIRSNFRQLDSSTMNLGLRSTLEARHPSRRKPRTIVSTLFRIA